ncbi:hypothetical protein DPX16_13230 [Anabarilius grahami]|uniref:Uncharacterized protein n=1 Tax=Anabarilius grahami TaxID=495550 RepID=A0A3N0YMQ9_ANAGA|nr:hypothetical protein DPX16_13230 [Anabarilius grahami]
MPAPAESFLRSEGALAEANYASLDPARFIENTNTYMTVDKHVAPFSESAKSPITYVPISRPEVDGVLVFVPCF